jgi:hypothetical protein
VRRVQAVEVNGDCKSDLIFLTTGDRASATVDGVQVRALLSSGPTAWHVSETDVAWNGSTSFGQRLGEPTIWRTTDLNKSRSGPQ